MTKKRIQKRKNISLKKHLKKLKKIKLVSNNKKKKSKIKSPKCQTEIQDIETQNISTSIKLEQNNIVTKENIIDYYSKSILNDFDTYSSDLFEQLLKDELDKEKLAQINEEILSYFGLTKDLRKTAFKYLSDILKQYNIPIKLYFKTVTLFDYFLINFYKNNNYDKKLCSAFFLSKYNNEFSNTKLILFILCCFYIINQIYNYRNFELKCLVNWNNKEEMTLKELNDLVFDILDIINCEFNILGIYNFLNIFIFDLNKRLKMITNGNIFINCYNKNVNYFAMKIVQEVSLSNINPSIQALAVLMFSLKYSKFLTEKYFMNENINFLVENWINSVKHMLINYNYEDIKRVIQWLNNYTNNK